MINSPVYFTLLAWMLIGDPRPVRLAIIFMVTSVLAALALRRSSRGRTFALLGILGVMLTENLLFVLGRSLVELIAQASGHLANSHPSHFSTLHTIDLAIALLGISAAACAAIFIRFGKSRIEISKVFPQLKFLETPIQIKETVSKLADFAAITAPNVCLIDSGLPSAFTARADGRYSLVVSVGLLESLDEKEVEACIAHEISHLKNNDFTLRFLVTVAKVALFARPLSYLIEPAVYRAREFLADSTAAKLIGGPDALVSALSKLKESYSLGAPSVLGSISVCNLAGRKGLLGIFDKHPDLDTRIKMLQEMRRE